MLATWQMRVPTLQASKTAARKGRPTRFRKTGCYLCSFFFLCFSLPFFFTGVLDGVGDGVPDSSGVGVGRTRG